MSAGLEFHGGASACPPTCLAMCLPTCPPAYPSAHQPSCPLQDPHAPLLRECPRGDAWENQVTCSTPPRPGSVLLPWADPRSHSPPCPCLCVQGRVCGLCGNFDGNALNDFTTRSQSVVGDVLEFGNSWKFSPSCPDARAPKDPCTANPYRKSWAQKQCSIINSATFSACRSQVGWGGGSGWGPDVGGWLTPCLPVGPGSGQQWASEDRCTRRTRPPTRQGIASPVPSAFPDHTQPPPWKWDFEPHQPSVSPPCPPPHPLSHQPWHRRNSQGGLMGAEDSDSLRPVPKAFLLPKEDSRAHATVSRSGTRRNEEQSAAEGGRPV